MRIKWSSYTPEQLAAYEEDYLNATPEQPLRVALEDELRAGLHFKRVLTSRLRKTTSLRIERTRDGARLYHTPQHGVKKEIGTFSPRDVPSEDETLYRKFAAHMNCMRDGPQTQVRKNILHECQPDMCAWAAFGSTCMSSLLRYDLTSLRASRCMHNENQDIHRTPHTKHRHESELVAEISNIYTALLTGKCVRDEDAPTLLNLFREANIFSSINAGYTTIVDWAILCINYNYTAKQAAPYILRWLLRLIQCARIPKLVDTVCPGFLMVAPPSSGKTWVQNLANMNLLDTDHLNARMMDEHPSVLRNILSAGFSVISNRWDWQHYVEEFQVIAILPKDINAILVGLRAKGIGGLREAEKRTRREYFRRKSREGKLSAFQRTSSGMTVAEKNWTDAYAPLYTHPRVMRVIFNDGESAATALETLFLRVLNYRQP